MKIRIDQLLVDRGLADSRARAQALVRAGLVVVGEHRVDKPGQKVDPEAPVRLKGEYCPFVSRGGLKLAGALKTFGLGDFHGQTGLDIGASTGGFTDCLLQHGIHHVWAVDTGRGQLHGGLRQDPRITLREQANARYLTPDWTDGNLVNIAVIDVSFISLKLILPPLKAVLSSAGFVLALVKPQFEAGAQQVGRGGVVRERSVHQQVLADITAFCLREGWTIYGLCRSEFPGPAGNWEFFVWLTNSASSGADDKKSDLLSPLTTDDINKAIEDVLDEIYNKEI